nr:MAG TPA: hypothetical protein [Caudoviricetes sp.]
MGLQGCKVYVLVLFLKYNQHAHFLKYILLK